MAAISKKRYLLLGIILCFVCDQAIKHLITQQLALHKSIVLWPKVFNLTLAYNTGGAFSLLEQYPDILTLVSSVIFTGLGYYAFTKMTSSTYFIAVLSLILGGALGNLWDRWTLGYVVDYLDFTLINYPVFNLADSFICIGTVLWLLSYVPSTVVTSHLKTD